MELLLFLLGLLLLALPVIAIVALVKAINLGTELRDVQARLARIEARMAAVAPTAAAPTAGHNSSRPPRLTKIAIAVIKNSSQCPAKTLRGLSQISRAENAPQPKSV